MHFTWILMLALGSGGAALAQGPNGEPLQCGDEIALGLIATEIALPWQADEGTARGNQFFLAGEPRSLVFGTRRLSPSGQDAETGGRFIAVNIATGETALSLEVPGSGEGPKGVESVIVSRRGGYAVSVSPHIEGPLYVYDLRRHRTLYRFRNTCSQYEWWRLGAERALLARANGNSLALAQLTSIGFITDDMESILDGMSSEETSAFIDEHSHLITSKLEEAIGHPFDPEDDIYPTRSVDFAPDESQFLVDDGSFLTIRNTIDGTLASRYPLSPGIGDTKVGNGDLNRRMTIHRASRFLNNGKSVLTVHGKDFSLWDTRSGMLSQIVPLELQLETDQPGWITVAPRGNYFAFSGRGNKGQFVTRVFAVDKNSESGLIRAREIKSFATNPSQDQSFRYPRIAFATNGDYLLGNAEGFIGFYQAGTAELKRSFVPSRYDPVSSVAVTPSGSVGVSLSASGRYLQVWGLNGSRPGTLLTWPGPGTIQHVSFSPDGEQLLIVRVEWDPSHLRAFYKTFVVPVEQMLR